MTATPIPRTLALTIYGDLDLTLLTEMPHGRKGIITKVLSPEERNLAYQKAKEELDLGRRVFVICPRIDEPDPKKELALLAKSAKSEQLRLQKEVFVDWEVGLLHGKMKPQDKEKALKDFQSGKTQILVATSVVEVGVNVPEATVMIIEGAERFGLAQLHQLRGRIARSNYQAYCFLFTEAKVVAERLKAVAKAANGFELAELDLTIRGEGTLSGSKQWGLSDLGMEGIRNIKMVEAARKEAEKMIEKDPELASFPYLKEKVEVVAKTTHFE
jgi:ATP-dependent DNA helicase RecG